MKKSDLFQIFINLSAEDRRALRKFVRSPFFNYREDVASLYEFLDRNADKSLDKINKEEAHAFIYPNLPYDDAQVRRCMNYLLKLLEQYLLYRQATASPLQNNVMLAGAYRKLGLEKHARQTLELAEKDISGNQLRDANYYESCYQLEAETLTFSQGLKRTAPRNLQQVSKMLDLAYLSKKLEQSCVAVTHGMVSNTAYDSGLLANVLDYLKNADWLDEHPAIALHYYYYLAATTEDDLYFEKLKQGIMKFEDRFSAAEIRKFYLLAINYSIQRFNRGDNRFLVEMFNLYQASLRNDVLLENGQLSRYAFKNIAGIAIRLGEFDWTARFIEKYGQAVEPRHRRNYTDYNLAKLHYARRAFPNAMQLLHKVEYEDVFLNLDAKILLLKIYFEQGENDAVDNFIQSFQRFLHRKRKELGYHLENYLNTLYFAAKLLTINPLDKVEKERLRSEIIGAKALGEREWLLERL